MAENHVCQCCGQVNNILFGNPFYLDKDHFLCAECARPIRNDINQLYYTKNKEEFAQRKREILAKCNQHFHPETCHNPNLMSLIIAKINFIYKDLPFSPKEPPAPTGNGSSGYSSANYRPAQSHGIFSNIGGKIKILAAVITWTFIIASIIGGISIMAQDNDLVPVGILVAVGGSLLGWVNSFLLYGFGQLIENTDILVQQGKRREAQERTKKQ